MYDKPLYRPCPICRTQLEDTAIPPDSINLDKEGWKRFYCPNCGSVVYINPFIGVIQGKRG